MTIGRKISSLRAFFRLAVRRRLISASPVAGLRSPKRAKRLPSFLGKDDAGRLLDGAAGAEGETDAALARALCEVLYGAGLRISEACHLDLADVEAEGNGARITVRQGKGRKDRIVPLGSKAWQALRDYFPVRLQRLAAPATANPPAARRPSVAPGGGGDRAVRDPAWPAPGPARRAPVARAPRGAHRRAGGLAARAPSQFRNAPPR